MEWRQRMSKMSKADYMMTVGEVLTDYNREIMQLLNGVRKQSAVHTDEEIKERANAYFEACADVGRLPDIASLALALGVSKVTLENWARGIQCAASRREVIQWCYTIIESAQLQASTVGGFNPILFMFLAKSKYGYREDGTIAGAGTTTIVEAGSTVDEIQNRYNTPLPVTVPSLETHTAVPDVDMPAKAEPVDADIIDDEEDR